jgi:hypothetical protein
LVVVVVVVVTASFTNPAHASWSTTPSRLSREVMDREGEGVLRVMGEAGGGGGGEDAGGGVGG